VIILLAAGLAPVLVVLAVAAVLLWPSSDTGGLSTKGIAGNAPGTSFVTARAVTVRQFDCQGVGAAPGERVRCAHVTARLTSGPDAGTTVKVDLDPTHLKIGVPVGRGLELARFRPVAGQPASYAFADFSRSTPMWWLAVTFALLVALVARLKGLAALVGLLLSFGVLIKFIIPALLAGEDPLAVGLVGCATIMVVLLYLAHGVSIRTTTALVGTLFGLVTSAILGTWAVGATHLTGVASEDDFTLTAIAGQVKLSGLLLCGIIVASLGILNDVTVTQASAVWELRAANPAAPPRQLFSGAMRIGRDHIASTVYTIVFAYAGAALPILLLINISQSPLGVVLTGEALAEEIIRTLVGSIGLVLSVPLTTAVGVALVRFARGHGPPPRPVRDRPWAASAWSEPGQDTA
jgi:uncharacterized membrane protein